MNHSKEDRINYKGLVLFAGATSANVVNSVPDLFLVHVKPERLNSIGITELLTLAKYECILLVFLCSPVVMRANSVCGNVEKILAHVSDKSKSEQDAKSIII